jgi:hypothetical protein
MSNSAFRLMEKSGHFAFFEIFTNERLDTGLKPEALEAATLHQHV